MKRLKCTCGCEIVYWSNSDVPNSHTCFKCKEKITIKKEAEDIPLEIENEKESSAVEVVEKRKPGRPPMIKRKPQGL